MKLAHKKFIKRDEPFICANCGFKVPASIEGSCRNHCPRCLHSMHLDINPGDRLSECRGIMEPVELDIRGGGEVRILHKCKKCGFTRWNKSAIDDEIVKFYESKTK